MALQDQNEPRMHYRCQWYRAKCIHSIQQGDIHGVFFRWEGFKFSSLYSTRLLHLLLAWIHLKFVAKRRGLRKAITLSLFHYFHRLRLTGNMEKSVKNREKETILDYGCSSHHKPSEYLTYPQNSLPSSLTSFLQIQWSR